jgi:hypothetical protein
MIADSKARGHANFRLFRDIFSSGECKPAWNLSDLKKDVKKGLF